MDGETLTGPQALRAMAGPLAECAAQLDRLAEELEEALAAVDPERIPEIQNWYEEKLRKQRDRYNRNVQQVSQRLYDAVGKAANWERRFKETDKRLSQALGEGKSAKCGACWKELLRSSSDDRARAEDLMAKAAYQADQIIWLNLKIEKLEAGG